MLLKTLKTVLFLCIIVSANAQNYVDATIFKPNGDSISGKINYQEWYINPEFISFKAANSFNIQEFRPKDISKFVIKGKNEIYESAVVDVLDQSIHDLEAKDVFLSVTDGINSLKFKNKTVFLMLLAKGKVSLYSYVDKRSIEHYFIQKDKKYTELLNVKFRIKAADGKFYLASYEDYKTKFAEILTDCPTLNTAYQSLDFKEKYLQDIVLRYNTCVGKQEYTKQDNTQAKIAFYVFSGISLPMAYVDGPYVNQFDFIVGKPSVPIGAGVEIGTGRELSPIRFGAEINLASNVYDHTFVLANGRSTQYNINLLGIHSMLYIKASFYNRKRAGHALFTKLGAMMSYYPKKSYHQTYNYASPIFPDYTEVIPLEKTSLTLAVSGGYKMKNLFVEAKYEPYALNLARFDSWVLKTARVTMTVGYYF